MSLLSVRNRWRPALPCKGPASAWQAQRSFRQDMFNISWHGFVACAIARGTTLSDHYHDSSSSSSLLILPGNLWALLRLSTMLAAYLSTRSKNYKKK